MEAKRSVLLPFPLIRLALVGMARLYHNADKREYLELDMVGRELRRFRTSDKSERIEIIKSIGPIHDPRITVMLAEVIQDKDSWQCPPPCDGPLAMLLLASSIFVHHHVPKEEWMTAKYWAVAMMWWEKNETEVRRQAALLPH